MTQYHDFQPIVSLSLREDGRYDMTFDWSDSYLGVADDDGHDDRLPTGVAACAAVDRWVAQQPTTIVIGPAQTYHGIVQVQCITCGHTTRDVAEMEMWNDYGVVCMSENHAEGSTRWTMADGTVTITTLDAEGNLTGPTVEE